VRRVGRTGSAAVACGVACLLATGCSTDAERDEPRAAERPRAERPPAERPLDNRPARPRVARATCPPDAANCRTASGRIIYVERVDPDGDGDAHFVLASREGVTGPGISVIDVKKSLRPSPLPGPGDRISAAGPVYRGSYGQRQIEAVELHVARLR
jgi:hypothetical protein